MKRAQNLQFRTMLLLAIGIIMLIILIVFARQGYLNFESTFIGEILSKVGVY